MLVIHPDDENVLDLYNVDYVCKVDFVEGYFIVEKLMEEMSTLETDGK